MKIAGIDPGLSGAVAIVEGRMVLDAIDMPVIGEGSQREINVPELGAFFEKHEPDEVWIELVSAMPSIAGADGVRRGMGAASSFRFGFATGQIRATVALYQIPYRLTVPAQWKKFYQLKGPDKEQSRLLALRQYPAAAHLLTLKKRHNIAESILIAGYGVSRNGLLAVA